MRALLKCIVLTWLLFTTSFDALACSNSQLFPCGSLKVFSQPTAAHSTTYDVQGYAKGAYDHHLAPGLGYDGHLNLSTGEKEKQFVGECGLVMSHGESVAAKATAPIEKFSNYIFKEGATHGKDAIFKGLGYGAEDSAQLAKMWQEQAAAKYAQGQYTLGKLDQYGQRINITIDVPGVGNAAGKSSSVTSGWIIRPDGSITLNTPFSGFPN